MSRSLLPLAALSLTLASAPLASAISIVAPNSAASTEGDINNYAPFDLSHIPNFSTVIPSQDMRYQQLYDASQFTVINPSGGTITQIIFRPDFNTTLDTYNGPFSTILPGLRIDLSTSSAADDGLSLTFASNLGADNTTVFGGPTGSPLSLSSAFTGPGAGPKDLDIVINLTTPFYYNPALGNLLMDVYNFGAGATVPFDAVDATGDGVSRIFTAGVPASSANADNNDTRGLVTAFTVVPVPEPTSGALLFAATACLGGFRRRKVA